MSDDEVDTSSVGDLVDAVRRGAGGLRDEAGRLLDDVRRAYEEERMRRALRLAAVLAIAYILLRKK